MPGSISMSWLRPDGTDFLQKAHFVKGVLRCSRDQQGVVGVPADPPKGRKVKSSPASACEATDRHERAKDYLSLGEVVRLLDAAKAGWHGVRDHLLLLLMFRHGLRVSEAVELCRDELDLDRARLWVRRLKGGLSVEQPIAGDELRAIKRHLATRADALPWLFVSERGQPLTRQAVNYLVAAAATRAGLPGVHPHTLRHSCGFALADKGHDLRLIQDYLGHRDPRHTVHYTRTAGRRFEGLWSR
jgi:type 1 fimbriae regulatory protein FimB